MTSTFSALTTLLAASLLLGCGGSSSGGSGGSGGTSSGGTSSGGTSSGGTNSGGTSSGGTSSGGTSSGGTSSGGTSSGGSAGAGGGSGGSAGGVLCGSTTCGTGEYCCHPSCVSDSTGCSGFALHCAGASDCPGQLCCATPQDGGFPVAQCAASCAGTDHLIVCVLAVSGSCPSGMTCHVTQQLPAEYGYCS